MRILQRCASPRVPAKSTTPSNFQKLASLHCVHCSDVTWASWGLRSPGTWLFIQQVNSNENLKASHHWPFVRGIHQPLVDSPHKGSVMLKTFPCYDIIMICPKCMMMKSLESFFHFLLSLCMEIDGSRASSVPHGVSVMERFLCILCCVSKQ